MNRTRYYLGLMSRYFIIDRTGPDVNGFEQVGVRPQRVGGFLGGGEQESPFGLRIL